MVTAGQKLLVQRFHYEIEHVVAMSPGGHTEFVELAHACTELDVLVQNPISHTAQGPYFSIRLYRK